MNIYEDFKIIKEERLEDKSQFYLYVLENSQGNIKIGKSSNIKERIKSLSNSNSGGNKLIRVAISPPTYITFLERTLHEHYHTYRLDGEWFDGHKISFEDIVEFIDTKIFNDGFQARDLRYKKIVEDKIKKQKALNDKRQKLLEEQEFMDKFKE
jgi:hypothetical protein